MSQNCSKINVAPPAHPQMFKRLPAWGMSMVVGEPGTKPKGEERRELGIGAGGSGRKPPPKAGSGQVGCFGKWGRQRRQNVAWGVGWGLLAWGHTTVEVEMRSRLSGGGKNACLLGTSLSAHTPVSAHCLKSGGSNEGCSSSPSPRQATNPCVTNVCPSLLSVKPPVLSVCGGGVGQCVAQQQTSVLLKSSKPPTPSTLSAPTPPQGKTPPATR